MNRILAIIPARAGSKGIPEKNTVDLGGRPLIKYTIDEAKKSKLINKIVVSTDCRKVKKIASEHAIELHHRSPELCKDDIPLVPDVAQAVSSYYPEFDIVVVLEPTYPFRNAKTIDSCISNLVNGKNGWVVTVSESRDHPYRCRKIEGDSLVSFFGSADVFAQRQDLPQALMLRGAVYATTKNELKEGLITESSWGYVKIDSKQAIDIDEYTDLLLARATIENENQ